MAEQFTSSQNLDIISNEVNKNLLTTPTFTDSKDLTISSPVKKENIFTSSNELDIVSPPKEEEISLTSTTQPDETISYYGEEPSTWEKIAYGIDKQNMFFGNVWRAGKAGIEAAFDPDKEFKEVMLEDTAIERAELNKRHQKFSTGKYDDDIEVLAAEMATFLVDPYYIFMYMTPWGRAMSMRQTGFKAAAKVAGVSAGAISLATLFDNLVQTGEVNPKSVAQAGALAGVLGPLSMKAFQVIGKL